MNDIVDVTLGVIARVCLIIIWLSGMVLASGFWSTFFTIFFPPWGWYLVIERVFWSVVPCSCI